LIYTKFCLVILMVFMIFAFSANKTMAESVPKNIILMISDGCGYNQINSASLYQYGKTGSQVYERFPIKLWVSTYSARDRKVSEPYKEGYDPEKAWSWFNYVESGATDSAAAATAMATGFKTYNGGIGVDANKNPIMNVSELAKKLGKSTGVVTNVQFSHATPACFIAHNSGRGKYDQIAQEMILDSRADVIMGCGNPLFNNDGKLISDNRNYSFVGGELVWNGLVNGQTEYDLDKDGVIENYVEDCDGDGFRDQWKLIQNLSEFRSLMKGDTPKRIIGVPQVFETLQCKRSSILDRDGNGKIEAKDAAIVDDIYKDPINPNVPSLQEMVSGALNVLDNNKDGFFLMVEGGTVDWMAGSNYPRMIEEEIEFNGAVEAVVRWVKTKSNWNETLIIVTGDHETGYLTGPNSGPDKDDPNDSIKPVWNPLVNNGKGKLPGFEWNGSGGHTNSLVPIFSNGVGSWLFWKYADETDPVRGPYIDNTEIAKVIFDLWGKK
jgi:alkaline phosphatase